MSEPKKIEPTGVTETPSSAAGEAVSTDASTAVIADEDLKEVAGGIQGAVGGTAGFSSQQMQVG